MDPTTLAGPTRYCCLHSSLSCIHRSRPEAMYRRHQKQLLISLSFFKIFDVSLNISISRSTITSPIAGSTLFVASVLYCVSKNRIPVIFPNNLNNPLKVSKIWRLKLQKKLVHPTVVWGPFAAEPPRISTQTWYRLIPLSPLSELIFADGSMDLLFHSSVMSSINARSVRQSAQWQFNFSYGRWFSYYL